MTAGASEGMGGGPYMDHARARGVGHRGGGNRVGSPAGGGFIAGFGTAAFLACGDFGKGITT